MHTQRQTHKAKTPFVFQYKYSTLVLLLIISFKYLLYKFKLKMLVWLMSMNTSHRSCCCFHSFRRNSLEFRARCTHTCIEMHIKKKYFRLWSILVMNWIALTKHIYQVSRREKWISGKHCRILLKENVLSWGIHVISKPKRQNAVDQVKKTCSHSTYNIQIK